jgi:hypothetical protein
MDMKKEYNNLVEALTNEFTHIVESFQKLTVYVLIDTAKMSYEILNGNRNLIQKCTEEL